MQETSIQLLNFQKKALRSILKKIFVNGQKEVTLDAPTGSGKTIMLSKLTDVLSNIADYGPSAASLNELDFTDKEIAEFDFAYIRSVVSPLEYIWFSPSTGGLAGQSMSSYERNFGHQAFSVHDFVNHSDKYGDIITFIGNSSIDKDSNILRREGERLNWTDVLDIKHTNGIHFCMIIDESHFGDTDKRAQIIQEVDPVFIIKASATPDKNDGCVVKITDDEVIEEGLITKRIRINYELPAATYEFQERKNLIEVAVKTYKNIRGRYIKMNGNKRADAVNPLIIIQYPNKQQGDELYEEMNGYIKDMGFNDDEIARWMTVNGVLSKENLAGISNNNSPIVFLHMKQAVATGWDCPRAKILIKLRDISSATFEKQVIGRLRRMPERHHYDDVMLDSCFIYTYDDNWIRKGEEVGTFTEARTVTLKPLGQAIAKSFNQRVCKEYKSNDNSIQGSAELREILEKAFIEKYGLDPSNKSGNIDIFKANKYRIDNRSNIFIRRGDADTIEKIQDVDLEKRRRIIRDEDNALRKAKAEISSKSKLNDEATTGKILQALFRKQDNPKSRDVKGTLLELNGREFNAFVVNNCERLARDFREFLQGTMNQALLRKQAGIVPKPYSLPESYVIKCDTRLQGKLCSQYNKNLYDGVDSSMKTSLTESRFQDWLEENASWWVKNGDVGEGFLSVIYFTATGKQYAFYPDYICNINQRIWIVETKGGETSEMISSNIDPQAENKFYALKDWERGNEGVKVAFVRYSAFQNELYASDTDYTEDMHTDGFASIDFTPWLPIDEVLK